MLYLKSTNCPSTRNPKFKIVFTRHILLELFGIHCLLWLDCWIESGAKWTHFRASEISLAPAVGRKKTEAVK